MDSIQRMIRPRSHEDNPNSFRRKYSLESRKQEADRIIEKYPERRPIIVEKDFRSDIDEIDKKKYLVPNDLTMGQFMYVIRKRIKLSSDKAIFLFINNSIPATSANISDIYEKHKGEDGFLALTYSSENTFG